MSYRHYQNTAPGWGTNQFQFGAPPAPSFQPQPSWGGMDFYRAHASSSPDPSLFHHAWERARDYSSAAGGPGVGMSEARHWHRSAYGGLGELNQMHPEEIGHAAAYEAYRTWIHNSSIYEPLSGDTERQREGLVGMAIAETTRLLQYAGRSRDGYSRMAASDAAASTASILFYQSRDSEDHYRSRSRSRHGSFSGSQYTPSMDPYAYDNDLSHRSRSHHRSLSRSGHRSQSHSRSMPMYPSSHHSSAMPIPMVPGSAGGYGGSYGHGHGHGHGHSRHGSNGSYGSPYVGSMPMQIAAAPSYGGSYHSTSAMPISLPGVSGSYRHRSNSISMPYQPAPMSYAQQPQTIVLTQPSSSSRKHKHRHSSGHHRSRSSDPGYRMAYPMQYASSARY